MVAKKKRTRKLPEPLVPPDVDLRDVPVPIEAFIELAMKEFGVSRKKAEEMVLEVARKNGYLKH